MSNNETKRSAYYKKIFKSMTFSQVEDVLDPDYKYIENKLKPIPTDSLPEYYEFLMDNGEYINPKTATVLRNKLGKSVSDFSEVLKDRLWKRYSLSEKVDLLFDKIKTLLSVKKSELYGDERIAFLEKIAPIAKFKINGESKPFDDDELDFINTQTISVLIADFEYKSEQECKEKMENHYKTIYAKKYLYDDVFDEKKSLSGSKKIVRLLEDTATKM